MCSVQEWFLNPCYSFELSPLNELYRGKLVSSIIVNIPYLLALTLSIILGQKRNAAMYEKC